MKPHHNFEQHNAPEGTPEDDPLGYTVVDAPGKTTKDLRDDIVTEAVYLRGNTHFGNTADLFAAVDAYHVALHKADREGK